MTGKPKFVTENNYTNRKVKYTTLASNLVPGIMVLVGVVNTIHPLGISLAGVNEQTVNEVLIGAGTLLAALQSAYLWAVGYFTHPAAGDGVKPKE